MSTMKHLPRTGDVVRSSLAITIMVTAMLIPVMIIGWAAKHIYRSGRH